MVAGAIYISDPIIHAEKRKDPEIPSFNEVVKGEFADNTYQL